MRISNYIYPTFPSSKQHNAYNAISVLSLYLGLACLEKKSHAANRRAVQLLKQRLTWPDRPLCTAGAACSPSSVKKPWTEPSSVLLTPALSHAATQTCATGPPPSSCLWLWPSVLLSCPHCGDSGSCSPKWDASLLPKIHLLIILLFRFYLDFIQ